MSDPDNLQNIMYVALPEGTERQIGEFTIDPEIMIPVEISEGNETWTMQNLSWELIVASMLKVLVHDSGHLHADYYRNFVTAAKPSTRTSPAWSMVAPDAMCKSDVAPPLPANA